jgi:hypothetical protein
MRIKQEQAVQAGQNLIFAAIYAIIYIESKEIERIFFIFLNFSAKRSKSMEDLDKIVGYKVVKVPYYGGKHEVIGTIEHKNEMLSFLADRGLNVFHTFVTTDGEKLYDVHDWENYYGLEPISWQEHMIEQTRKNIGACSSHECDKCTYHEWDLPNCTEQLMKDVYMFLCGEKD